MKVILMKHNTDDQMNWAGNDDTRKYLKLGETYEVDRIKQGSSYTRYYITDVAGSVTETEVSSIPVDGNI